MNEFLDSQYVNDTLNFVTALRQAELKGIIPQERNVGQILGSLNPIMPSGKLNPNGVTVPDPAKASSNVGGKLSAGLLFAHSIYDAFSPVKSAQEMLAESGQTQGNAGGFGYVRQKSVDTEKQLGEVESKGISDVFKTTSSGITAGSQIAGVPGAIIGGIGGLFGGLFGMSSRRNRALERINEANKITGRLNTAGRATAMSKYYQQEDAMKNSINVFKHGKDSGRCAKYAVGKDSVYTPYGKMNVPYNSMVSYGESILQNIDNPDTANGVIVRDGMPGVDSNKANLQDSTIVLGEDIDMRDGMKFKDKGAPFTAMLERIQKMPESKNKLRGVIGQNTDKLQKELATRELRDLAAQQKRQHDILAYNEYALAKSVPGFAYGKSERVPTIGLWSSIGYLLPTAIGALGQSIYAGKSKINTPNVYAGNLNANAATDILAGLKLNPYPIINKVRNEDRQSAYRAKQSGGLTPGQRYLADVARTRETQRQISDLLVQNQQYNNQLKQAYAAALIEAGENDAKRRQAANQYNEEYKARAHAARQQGVLSGLHDMYAALQQMGANEFKRHMYNGTLGVWQQELEDRRYK